VATYVDVLIDVPRLGDKRFTYRFTQDYFLPYGAKVRVPFGAQRRDGFVVAQVQEPKDLQVKDIMYAYDLRFLPGPKMLEFAKVLAEHYCVGLSCIMSLMWPPVAPRARQATPESMDAAQAPSVSGLADPKPPRREVSKPLLVWGKAPYRWERYRETVKHVLGHGESVLVLVPETKDIPIAEKELRLVAGGRLTVLHSYLTGLVRRQSWQRAMSDRPCVVLGTRSSVFVDVPALGAIIVDDEWSDSYKSLETPFYHGRTVARMRASFAGYHLVLGASHPSLDAYRRVQTGEMALSREDSSFSGRVTVIDIRKGGTRREVISQDLADALRETFSKGEKAFLFLNRRGEATSITCQDCGNTLMCPHCGSPLSYHSKGPTIRCHICDYQTAPPDECPVCGGHRWRFLGFGVERAQKEFLSKFPSIALYRLDKDTSRDQSIESLSERFAENRPACLLGTQMALNLRPRPKVAMVGVLSGDTILNLPDFTSSEKVFHLLSELLAFAEERQDSGGGHLVIQTYNPEHHAVLGLSDPEHFYNLEIENRESLGYPPAKCFFKVRFSGKNASRVQEAARLFAENCCENCDRVAVLGPIPTPKPKCRGQSRWQVALRGHDHKTLVKIYVQALQGVLLGSDIKVSLDVEPVDAF
jgi:primosomal protein N' (replication factor Y)